MHHMVLQGIRWVPYSRLFSLGANFFEFPEWTHNSGKFILGSCTKFEMVRSAVATYFFILVMLTQHSLLLQPSKKLSKCNYMKLYKECAMM